MLAGTAARDHWSEERHMTSANARPQSDGSIPVRAIVTFALFALFMPAVIFLAAGTVRWTTGWIYYGLAVAASLGSRALVAIVHPDLLAERARSQRADDAEPWDRYLSPIVGLIAPLVSLIVVGLDKRWLWSPPLPSWVAAVGVVLFVLGYAFSTWALVTNRFFSAVVRIQRERGQHVVTDGPYRIVRHPGYAGGLLASLATPLVLGTLWGLIPAAAYAGLIAVRTALEDRTLQEELPGYREYVQRTRFRLLPGLW
jgi:protein-S-isoprenylcysteine O-methyltransferase Ste14